MAVQAIPLEESELGKRKRGVVAKAGTVGKVKAMPLAQSGISRTAMTTFGAVNVDREDEQSFKEMSFLGKVFDVIGRPGYAHKAALSEAMKQRNYSWKEILTKEVPAKAFPIYGIIKSAVGLIRKDPKVQERYKALWRGFTAEERVEANQMFEKLGISGVPGLGLAAEIALDPLTFGGYKAAGTLVRKGVGFAARTAKKIPGVKAGLETVKIGMDPVKTALRKAFVTKSTIPKLDDLIGKHLGEREFLKGEALKYGVKIRNAVQDVAKRTGKSADDIVSEIDNLIELPGKTKEAIQGTKEIATSLKRYFKETVKREIKYGVPIKEWANEARGMEYFPRITTQEAKQYLKQASKRSVAGGGGKIWTKKIANAIQRKTGDFTLEEFNALVAKEGLASLGGKKVAEFFMKNPAYVAATRGIRSAKAVTSAQFLDDVGKTFAEKVGVELPEAVTKLNPSLKGLKFAQEIADEVTRVIPKYISPDDVGEFGRLFNKVQNTWKKWTLAPFPKYHLRNMVGNVWNNYLADVVDPRVYRKAAALQGYRKYGKVGGKRQVASLKALRAARVTTREADDIIASAEKTGVLGKGWFGADIEKAIEQEFEATEGLVRGILRRVRGGKGVAGKAKAVGKEVLQFPRRLLVGKGMAVGSTIENNARLAHFVDRLNKGDDALRASQSVKKYLFDYGDLTHFEKQTMKRIFPFFTWTRKNLPLQLEVLWKKPQKLAPLQHLLRNRDEKDLLRLKYARPDLWERLPVELRRDADTVTYVPLEGLIPSGDLAKLGVSIEELRNREMPGFFVELLSPYLRAPLELTFNKSFYFEREIEQYKGQTRELLGVDIPVRDAYLITSILPQARLVNELNKLTRKIVRKEALTKGEQAFSQALSSVYKVNTRDLRDRALMDVMRKIEALRRGKFWAKRYERTEEGKRIMQTYEELKELRRELKAE